MTDYERDVLLGEVDLAERIQKATENATQVFDKTEQLIESLVQKKRIIHSKEAIKEITEEIKQATEDMTEEIKGTLDADGIIRSEAQSRSMLIQEYGGKVKTLSTETLRNITDLPCVSGYTLGQKLDEIEKGLSDIWLNNVRLGRINGWTTQRVVKTVLEGFGGVPYTKQLRNSVERNARTALQWYANEAKTEVYRENEDIFSGYKWLATLDTRVCPECAKLDGEIRKSLDDFDTPPLHYNCRCTIVPIVEGMDITNEPISIDELNGTTSGKSENFDFVTKQARESDRKAISEDLAKIAPEHAERLRKYAQDMECDLYYKGDAYCRGNTIYLDIMADNERSTVLGFKTNMRTFLHESGHWLDWHMVDEGKTLHERLPDLKKKLRRDFLNHINELRPGEKALKSLSDAKWTYLQDTEGRDFANKELCIGTGLNRTGNPLMNSVSDILSGLLKEDFYLPYYHDVDYWKQEYTLEKETIAHFFEAMGSGGKKLKTVKGYFPEAFDYFAKEVKKSL